MRASVYRLRDRGLRMPRPIGPVEGDLVLAAEYEGDHAPLVARLGDGSAAVGKLPPLANARVVRITGAGMVIRGDEVVPRGASSKSAVSRYPQTWWVFVWTEAAVARYESADPIEAMDNVPFK